MMKNVRPVEIEQRAGSALMQCLAVVPSLEVMDLTPEVQRGSAEIDWLARVRLGSQQTDLIVEVKSNGQPRQAESAVNQLLRYCSLFPRAYGVFIAPYISPQAAEICREADVGYVDLLGNCRLAFDSVYIEKQGRQNQAAEKRTLRSLFSPKAERVLRVLLTRPGQSWKLQALAQEAGVSLGQTHNVKCLLEDRGWLKADPAGVSLQQPRQALAAWAGYYIARRKAPQLFYTLDSVGEIENRLAMACRQLGIRYGLAAFSAAARLAPFVRYQRAYAYVAESDIPQVAGALGLRPVATGANFILWNPDDGVWYDARELGGAATTSPIQTYLDLLGAGERGEEAAEFLLRQVIEPTW